MNALKLVGNAALPERAPEPDERRQQNRYLTIFRVAKLLTGTHETLGIVRNISAGGMMVDAYAPLEPGSQVSISLDENRVVTGKVAWNHDLSIGFEFEDKVDVAEILAKPVPRRRGQTVRQPRVSVSGSAMVWHAGRYTTASVCDLSQQGAKIRTRHEFGPSDKVKLYIDGFGPRVATIKWYGNGYAGMGFDRPVPLKNLMAWLSRHGR